jgi:hypothetical protein
MDKHTLGGVSCVGAAAGAEYEKPPSEDRTPSGDRRLGRMASVGDIIEGIYANVVRRVTGL